MYKNTRHLPNLTPLRGLAALAVLLFHKVTLYSSIDPNAGDWEKLVDAVFNKGALGVNFFFTLSGFLITYLIIGEVRSSGRFNFLNFVVRRILRIWPVYFIVVLAGFIVIPMLGGSAQAHNPVLFAAFLSNFDEIINGINSSNHVLTVLWSVSIEEQFYLFWAIVLGLFSLKVKRYTLFFIAIIGVSIGFRLNHVGEDRIIYYHTLSVISDMAIGGLFAYSYRSGAKIIRHIRKMPSHMIAVCYIVGITYCLTHNLFMKGNLYALDRVIKGLFWGFVITEQCFGRHSIIKSDNIPTLKYIGKISYGIYAYHLIIFFLFNEYFELNSSSSLLMDLGLNTLVVVLGTITIAGVSYKYVELPLLRMKSRLFS